MLFLQSKVPFWMTNTQFPKLFPCWEGCCFSQSVHGLQNVLLFVVNYKILLMFVNLWSDQTCIMMILCLKVHWRTIFFFLFPKQPKSFNVTRTLKLHVVVFGTKITAADPWNPVWVQLSLGLFVQHNPQMLS